MSDWVMLLKWGSLVTVAAALAALGVAAMTQRDSVLSRLSTAYVAYLDRRLRNLFLRARGTHVLGGQVLALASLGVAALQGPVQTVGLGVPLAVFGPALCLEYWRRARLRLIQANVDGFALTLANALKSTPSIGQAFAQTEPLLAAPLNQEVALALKEMRLGIPLEQALLNMARRIGSLELDTVLAGLLIARQIGGNLTEVLETTAATLREMARLRGVVRAKTAESKVQLMVLAVMPFAIVLMFDAVNAGYFDPLLQSPVGWAVIAVAAALWVTSLVAASRLVKVDL